MTEPNYPTEPRKASGHELCTVSDKKFVAKGLAMYDSLCQTKSDFTLYFLCVDNDTYEIVDTIRDERLLPLHINNLLKDNPALQHLRDTDHRYYLWSLASQFTDHMMKWCMRPMTYVDADIFFHQSVNSIIDKIDRDVGVFRHRQFDIKWDHPSGKFNVGIVHFKYTNPGRALLNWWADVVLHKKYATTLGQCGDQKYLDAFYYNGRDYLWIDGDIGHGAPWEWQLYDLASYLEDGCITWQGQKQKLAFTHFSQFQYNLEDGTYIPSTMHHIYTPMEMYGVSPLRNIYDNYFRMIQQAHRKYGIPQPCNT